MKVLFASTFLAIDSDLILGSNVVLILDMSKQQLSRFQTVVFYIQTLLNIQISLITIINKRKNEDK